MFLDGTKVVITRIGVAHEVPVGIMRHRGRIFLQGNHYIARCKDILLVGRLGCRQRQNVILLGSLLFIVALQAIVIALENIGFVGMKHLARFYIHPRLARFNGSTVSSIITADDPAAFAALDVIEVDVIRYRKNSPRIPSGIADFRLYNPGFHLSTLV